MDVGNNNGGLSAEVERHVVSQVSRIRASNGDSNLSSETLKAIQQGAPAPQVVRPKETTETNNDAKPVETPTADSAPVESTPVENTVSADFLNAVETTVHLQQEPQTAFEDDSVIVELSSVAVDLLASTETNDQPVVTDPIVSSNVDTASVALGNAVDIKA